MFQTKSVYCSFGLQLCIFSIAIVKGSYQNDFECMLQSGVSFRRIHTSLELSLHEWVVVWISFAFLQFHMPLG